MKINPIITTSGNSSSIKQTKQIQNNRYYTSPNIDIISFNGFQQQVKTAKKPGIIREVINWFKNLFKKKVPPTPAPPVLTATQKIAKNLQEKYGIKCDFDECLNVAELTEKTVHIMETIFGIKSIPNRIEYKKLTNNDLLGYFLPDLKDTLVCFNKDKQQYNSIEDLKKFYSEAENMEKKEANEKLIHLREFATTHFMHPFIHEFAHSAHFNNIKNKQNNDDVLSVTWLLLQNKQLPNRVAQFILKFKLGKYANTNLCEFMAERASQDICKHINNNGEYNANGEIIDYSDIFSRKWNNRYICPQSYLDYYTQQIWNGDLNAIERAEDKIDIYLKEIERKEARMKQKEIFVGKVDYVFGKIREFGGNITRNISGFLDSFNRIKQTYTIPKQKQQIKKYK